MQLEHKPQKVMITGKSGSGKSTFYTRFINKTDHQFIFVFDHEAEFAYRSGISPVTTEEQLQAYLEKPTRILVFDPCELFPGDIQAGYAFFCEFVFEFSKERPGKKLLACDELQKIVNFSSLPRELCLVIETGRRYGVDWVAISQQCNLVHNRILNQVTELISFCQLTERAIKFLAEMGFPEDELRKLQDGEFFHLDLRSETLTRGIIELGNGGKQQETAVKEGLNKQPEAETNEAEGENDSQPSTEENESP